MTVDVSFRLYFFSQMRYENLKIFHFTCLVFSCLGQLLDSYGSPVCFATSGRYILTFKRFSFQLTVTLRHILTVFKRFYFQSTVCNIASYFNRF